MTSSSPATIHPSILVFDSGVGGLSIATEIQKKMPFVRILYASDNAFFPYGTKGEAELIDRVDKVLSKIISRHSIDLLVIACNTASTLTLPHCRQRFAQPIVGVVPAIKPAAQLTQTNVIGLLATPATVARPYTHNLIQEHAPLCQVISVGSSELVAMAEKRLRGENLNAHTIDSVMQRFFETSDGSKMDTIVLACTHFPLIRNEIMASLSRINPGNNYLLIDSGEAIARRVESLLVNLDLQVTHSSAEHLALFTKISPDIETLKPALQQYGFKSIQAIDVC
jgi:glutamate racemase